MHQEQVLMAGQEITTARKALILLHGRGGSAADILSLVPHLHIPGYALAAPQATNHTWYPLSFMAPPAQNEPWLSSALQVVKNLADGLLQKGIARENIYFLGFSQGACLMLEFIARNAARYGGAVAFTGGLIGDKLYTGNYGGNFDGMPVFIGSSNPDPHVPVQRVKETTALLTQMGATVTESIYDQMGHTITLEELEQANRLVFR